MFFFTHARKKMSKFPATRPLGSNTFLHEINTSEVKVTPVLKKIVLFISVEHVWKIILICESLYSP